MWHEVKAETWTRVYHVKNAHSVEAECSKNAGVMKSSSGGWLGRLGFGVQWGRKGAQKREWGVQLRGLMMSFTGDEVFTMNLVM